MITRKQIYLAAPLFNDRERSFNKFITNQLLKNFNVFLPQEDGLLLENLIKKNIERGVAEKTIYETDTTAMKESDILLAVLDGASIDEGVAFELGFCGALGKLCIGLQTDVRRQLPTGNNPMIEQSCDRIFNDVDALLKWLNNNQNNLSDLPNG